jgi:hypothetical protein
MNLCEFFHGFMWLNPEVHLIRWESGFWGEEPCTGTTKVTQMSRLTLHYQNSSYSPKHGD